MPRFNEQMVKLVGGTVIWEDIVNPGTVEQGDNAGKPQWGLKVVFPPNHPDIAAFEQLAQETLAANEKLRGVLPPGGHWPIRPVAPGKFEGRFDGWLQINFKTLRSPDIYDEAGAPMPIGSVGPILFTGQTVDVLAHCYAYSSQMSSGVSAGLDAFSITLSANAERLAGGGPDTSAAFGGGPAAQPAYGQQPAAQPAYGQQPAAQPAYGQQPPAYGQQPDPKPQAAAPNAAGQYQNPTAAPQPAYGAPTSPSEVAPNYGHLPQQ